MIRERWAQARWPMQLSPKSRSVLSGAKTSPAAKLARLILRAWAGVFAINIRIRNRLYDRSILKSRALSVPVICIGNITVGGTGKTPLVIWLCRYLRGRGLKVAVLTRGYKAGRAGDNDETVLLRRELEDVPIIVDANRLRGGRTAIKEHHVDVLVMDDGFQHRQLYRDLDIIAIDCMCPFGYNFLLPRGLLREPAEGLRRADAVVLTRSDTSAGQEIEALADRVRQLLGYRLDEKEPDKKKIIACSKHKAVALYNADGSKVDLRELQGRKVYAFCGIGNPEAFETTLKQLGAEICGMGYFGDHIHYGEYVLQTLPQDCREHQADWLLTTEKDWVKLERFPGAPAVKELHWLKIETVFTQGREQLVEIVDKVCQKKQR